MSKASTTERAEKAVQVFRGQVVVDRKYPGIYFAWAWQARKDGRGHAVPVVIVDGDYDAPEVLAAAERVGRGLGMVLAFRRAIREWSKSVDHAQNPFRVTGDTAEAARQRRVQQAVERREIRWHCGFDGCRWSIGTAGEDPVDEIQAHALEAHADLRRVNSRPLEPWWAEQQS